jgi:hypothetical protein
MLTSLTVGMLCALNGFFGGTKPHERGCSSLPAGVESGDTRHTEADRRIGVERQAMKAFRCLWRFLGVSLLLVLVVSAAAATASVGGRDLKAPVGVDDRLVATDGSRIAYSALQSNCSTAIFDWSPRTGTTTRVSGKESCNEPFQLCSLAVAGTRFTWITAWDGNTESGEVLRSASLPQPNERVLAKSLRSGGSGDGGIAGDSLGALVGAGNLIAVSHWWTNARGAVTRSEVDLVAEGGLRRLVSGLSALSAQSIDAGRIAVLRSDRSVGIYLPTGRPLRAIKLRNLRRDALHGLCSPYSIALLGNKLLVLTDAGTLDIYNSRSGAYRRSWPVPRSVRNLDAYGGVAAYADEPSDDLYKVHVLSLATGKDVVLGRSGAGVAIDAAGLVYAKWYANRPSTLVAVPLRRVLEAVS